MYSGNVYSISHSLIQELSSQFISWTPKIGVGFVIMLSFILLGSITKFLSAKIAKTNDPQKNQVVLLLGSSANVAILVIGCITALGSIGINVSALVASLGLSGFALSFALKDALANLLAGIMLFMYKPFKIGDTINICDLEGVVFKLSLRYIHLKAENKEILIPNSCLLTNNISILNRQ